MGSWNAGIIGYYQGGTVINIDGLVNNDVYEYAATNDLPSYIEKASILYIMDFEKMLTDKKRRMRGGYDDPRFLKRIETIKVFDNHETDWGRLTLYEIATPAVQ